MSHDPVLLATAVEAVLKAGEIQLSRFGSGLRIDKKGAIDLVTEADVEVETMFRELVAERFPAHDVLAEEMTGSPSSGPPSRYRWVFDPIDGTTNFAHGLPIFCASLALEIDGRLEVAAVYDPTRRELFTAERGEGAYLNGSRLYVSSAAVLVDSMLVTGFPYTVHETGEEIVSLFGAFVRRARAVRRLGSAALDLCYVAAGRMDGFWEQHLNFWDIAAGVLLVEEAGGKVTGTDGSHFSSGAGHVLASNGRVHSEMLQVISEHAESRSRKRTP
jgi:myo-inositol-1(or 4)-monophosphatase